MSLEAVLDAISKISLRGIEEQKDGFRDSKVYWVNWLILCEGEMDLGFLWELRNKVRATASFLEMTHNNGQVFLLFQKKKNWGNYILYIHTSGESSC